ncbi:MAG: ABC transporter ATP-binding protein [Fibrobacterota bacterium]
MKTLQIKKLSISFPHAGGRLRAVDKLSLTVHPGEIHCLVGESGCGKSVTSLGVLSLIEPPGRIDGGEILFQGENLLHLSAGQMRRVRGGRISMIFQDPMNSLNPVYTCGDQVAEVLQLHRGMPRAEALQEAQNLFQRVHIQDARRRVHQYPHELSGGMRQRVMIAMAIAGQPDLLIADEPTTALDVTVQARILEEMLHLRDTMDLSILFITHDLGVVARIADRVTVLYAGCVAESGPVRTILDAPAHPYTQGLLRAVPTLNAEDAARPLAAVPGQVEPRLQEAVGCPFANRCPRVFARCRRETPPAFGRTGHIVHCFLLDEEHHGADSTESE